ncbi:MAG: hypothetical protein ACM3ML_05770 [Micromonosporaceae bacterium]
MTFSFRFPRFLGMPVAGPGSKALASRRLLVHDRGRVLADLACAIADGAQVISDFRVMADQRQLFGLVASVPTAWRTLNEIAAGGERTMARVAAAVHGARRTAWAQIVARHGSLPGIAIADKTLDGVIGIRLDASVVACHSDRQGAEPNFKGFGLLTELPRLSSQFSGQARLAPLRFLTMIGQDEPRQDMASVVIASLGELHATGDPWEPYQLADSAGEVVQPVAAYLRDLQVKVGAGTVSPRWARSPWPISRSGRSRRGSHRQGA